MSVTTSGDWRSVTDRLSPLLDARRAPRAEAGVRLTECRVCDGTGRAAPMAPCVEAAECSACGGLGYDVGI